MPGHLITHLKAKNFMGKDINEPIGQKTIFTGNNTVGKSTRANLIAITILGFSPFSTKTTKKPAGVLDDFGDGKKMVTEITCGGVIFERKFTRSEKGSVSNFMRVNKTKVSKGDFQLELFKAGNPQIIDLGAFIGLSDAEKINTLFKLYPPGADLSNLDSNIEKSKKKISRLNESISDTGGAIKKLIESKTAIEMPAGTLAETQAAIENLTKGVLDAKEALKIADEKNAAELKAAEVKPDTQAEINKTMEGHEIPFSVAEKNYDELKAENQDFKNHIHSNMSFVDDDKNITKTFHGQEVVESLQKIIDIMVKSGCVMCVAGMVVKKELRKYKGGAK